MSIFFIPPDIIKQILIFLKNIVIHNGIALIFTTGAGIWFLLALYRPTRGKLIALVGFLCLLFAFEYNKHIAQPLLAQTQQTLQTQIMHVRFDWLSRVILIKITPLLLFSIGAICVIGGVIADRSTNKKTKK